jgi:hypothetical protein
MGTAPTKKIKRRIKRAVNPAVAPVPAQKKIIKRKIKKVPRPAPAAVARPEPVQSAVEARPTPAPVAQTARQAPAKVPPKATRPVRQAPAQGSGQVRTVRAKAPLIKKTPAVVRKAPPIPVRKAPSAHVIKKAPALQAVRTAPAVAPAPRPTPTSKPVSAPAPTPRVRTAPVSEPSYDKEQFEEFAAQFDDMEGGQDFQEASTEYDVVEEYEDYEPEAEVVEEYYEPEVAPVSEEYEEEYEEVYEEVYEQAPYEEVVEEYSQEPEYDEQAVFEASYDQSQGDDVFDFDDTSDYEEFDEQESFEEDYADAPAEHRFLNYKSDKVYVPKLKKEERKIYLAYRNFLQSAFSASIRAGYEPVQPRVQAKNMGPKLKDDVVKILQEDMINAWSIMAAVYPYELGGLSGNETDDELLSIAERSGDEDLQDLIFSHIEVLIELEACEIREEVMGLRRDKKKIREEYNEMKYMREKVIETYVELIEKNNFPVDARKLMTNYLRAASKSPEKAYETLTTNPAMFSPILVDKMPRRLLGLLKPSPSDAKKMNKKIAKFLKKAKPQN